MAVTSPPSITALPTPPDPTDRTTFNTRAYPWGVAQQTLATEVGAVATNVYDNAVLAEAAATTATTAASNNYKGAWSSLTGSLATPATATHLGRVWILEESVADVTAHTPGTSSKWVELYKQTTPSSSASATITADRTLTNTSSRAQRVASTMVGCCIVLPDATTLDPGTPFYLQNTGTLPIGVRANGGTLLGGVDGRGHLVATCVDTSTAAGVWQIDGAGLLPGLVTVDVTLSSTYATTSIVPAVNLDNSKSIHFAAMSNGFAALVIDSQGKAAGTPVSLETGASSIVLAAFKITSTTAIVFWEQSTNYRCAVLTVSGTSISVGTVYTTTTNWNPGTDENGIAPPKFVQLSTSLYLVVDNNSTTDVCATAVSVSGTVCTIGTRVTAAVADIVAGSTQTYVIDATSAVVFYKRQSAGPTTPWFNEARVITVSGTAPTINTAATVTGVNSTNTVAQASVAQLTSSLYVVADNNNTSNTVTAAAVSISSTTVSPGTAITVDSSLTAVAVYPAGANSGTMSKTNRGITRMSDTTALLTYRQGASSATQSRAVVLTASGTNTLAAGGVLQGSFSGDVSSSAAGYGATLPASPGEMLGCVQYYVGSAAYSMLVPHLVSGSAITAGAAREVGVNMPFAPDSLLGAKLANGNYLAVGNTGGPSSNMVVAQSDGRGVALRGVIDLPWHAANSGSGFSMPDLGSGTLVRTPSQGQVGSTALLRLVRVEVAA